MSIRLRGIGGYTEYVIPDTFPMVNHEYDENEYVDIDSIELGQFVISDGGEAFVVLDKFDTQDGYGEVVLTGNEYGDVQFWSTNASFYLVQ